MRFKKVTKKDLPLLKKYLLPNKSLNSFYSLGVLFGWREFTKLEYFFHHDTLLFRGYNYTNEKVYFFPVGDHIDEMLSFLKPPYTLVTIPEEYAKIHYPDSVFDETDFDYLYRFNDLFMLKGKKYLTARNNLNHFKKNYPNFTYSAINRKNLGDIRSFLNKCQVEESEKLIEHKINYSVLDHFFDLELFGGILYIDAIPIAFIISERKADIVFMHFEKGFAHQYRGCLEMVRSCFFTSLSTENVSIINREEDVGDLGLRTAKMRLGPVGFVYKYIIHR